MRNRILLVSLLILVGGSFTARAEIVNDLHAKEQVREVALFQNGYSYFISEIKLKADTQSSSFFCEVPAIMGTFWVAYDPSSLEFKSLTAGESEYFNQCYVTNFSEMIKANIGQKIRVMANEKEYEGTLLRFADQAGRVDGEGGNSGSIPPEQARLFILQTEAGLTVLNPADVKMLEIASTDVNTVYQRIEKKWLINAEYAQLKDDAKFDLSYLGKGLSWYPSYYLNFIDDATASLSAKAVVQNDACDLENVNLKFVIGSPVLDVSQLSPMTGRLYEQMRSSGLGGNVYYKAAPMRAAAMEDVSVDYGTEGDAIQLGDLYFYPYDSVSLKKGKAGYYPLFTSKLTYENLYVWDVQSNDPVPRITSSYDRGAKYDESQPVWYCIKLKNETKMPWTSASVEMVRENMMLGQTKLPETPMGDYARLTINKAQNIDAQSQEVETDRVRNAAEFAHNRYDLITAEGKLTVRNFKSETIKLEINKIIEGKIVSSSPEGISKPITDGVFRVNPMQKMSWEVEIKAGETMEIVYTYKKYVR